jgi:phenylalanyl-tRNA synthetase alpha subunit
MSANCCHCFKDVSGKAAHVKCDGCSLNIHIRCLTLSEKEVESIKSWSANIKVLCNRCNVTFSTMAEIKTLVNSMKTSFDERFAQLETLIRSNTTNTNPADRETIIEESVERSVRACNVISYNVKKDPHVEDVEIANDILNVIDTSLAVSPENVVRLGKSSGRKPAPLKLRLNNSDSARACLRKQSVLLGKDVYAKIVIREDRTPRQMQYLKSLREELNQRINSGETNLTIKYINRVPQKITKQKN